MNWIVDYLPEAVDDLKHLDGSVRIDVLKAITKVRQDPTPRKEDGSGGFGLPLGNKFNLNLTGALKIVLKKKSVRIVYKLIEKDNKMLIVVIGAREDEKVYKEAYKRILKHKL